MKWQKITTHACVIFTSLFLFACGSSDNNPVSDPVATGLTMLGHRSYLLKLPDNYQPDRSYKLLLAFHGSGGVAHSMQNMAQLEKISEEYIVVYPNSAEVEWNEGCSCNVARDVDDLGFVDEIIADIQKKHIVQTGEIYAAGFSQGGLFTQNLACNRSEIFKAVAVVAASMSKQLAENCSANNPISVLMIHGTADQSLPYEGLEHSNFGLLSSPQALRLLAKKQASLPYRLLKQMPNMGAVLSSYTNGLQKLQLISVIDAGHRWNFPALNSSEKIIEFFSTLDLPELPDYSSAVTVDQKSFHVRSMGLENGGPAVVLLAGPNENYHSDSAWFAALQPLLAQKYRVYSIDRLGNAYSSVDEALSYSRFSDDLANVLQQLNEQQLMLVAFSSGSISARQFYQQYQSEFDIKAMLYVDPDIPLPHSVSLYQSYPADWYLENLQQLLPHLASGAWTERTLNKITAERELAEQLVSAHADLMDWTYFEQISQQRLLIPNQQSRAREIAAYTADLNQYAALPMVTGIPVSVIDSDFESDAIAQAPADQIAALQQWQQEGTQWSQEQASVSNGQYIALSDSNHLVPLQQPQQIQQALDWLFAQLQLP